MSEEHFCLALIPLPSSDEEPGDYGETFHVWNSELDKINALLPMSEEIYAEAVTLGRKIYTALEEEYVHQTSAEALTETLVANEYTYLADGRSFRIASPA